VAELQWEMTQAWEAIIMAGPHTAQAERMAQERVILLATARGEASKVAQRVSALDVELVATRRAWDVTEHKIPSLAARTAWPNGDG
jgi:hypothetical protein